MALLTPLVLEQEALLRRFAKAPDQPLPETKKDLAAELGRDPSNLNKTLKLLEGEGLTYPGGGFGAAEKLGITEKGREALAALDRANGTTNAVRPRSSSDGEAGAVADDNASRSDGEAGAVADDNTAPEGFGWFTHAEIRPDPNNARKVFDEKELNGLAESLADKGLMQKPAVRRVEGETGVQLVAGERRWRAWGLLIERGTWPADHRELLPIMQGDAAFTDEAGLIENLQRQDLKPLEEARGFQRLIDEHGYDTAKIAEKVRFTQRFVQQRLQLLGLKPDDMKALDAGKITIEDARKRIAAYPKPFELTPAQLVMFLEVAERHARLGLDVGWNKTAHTHYAMRSDEVFQQLDGVVLDEIRTWDAQATVALADHGGRRALLQYTGVDSPEVERIAGPLAEARAALGSQPAAAGLYVTTWLNAPYDPDPAIIAEVKEREEAAERQETERRAEIAKSDEAAAEMERKDQAFLAGVEALENDATDLGIAEFQARFQALLADRPTPWRIEFVPRSHRDRHLESVIHYGDGRRNEEGDVGREAVRRLIVIAVNRACGLAATSGPYLSPLDRPAFEQATDLDTEENLLAGDDDWDSDDDGETVSDILDEGDAPAAAEAAAEPDEGDLPASLKRIAGIPAEVDS